MHSFSLSSLSSSFPYPSSGNDNLPVTILYHIPLALSTLSHKYFALKTVSIGQNAQFAVVSIVLVGCKLVTSHADARGVSKVIIHKGVAGALRNDFLEAIGGIVGIIHRSAVIIRGVVVGSHGVCRQDGDQISNTIVSIEHTVTLGVNGGKQSPRALAVKILRVVFQRIGGFEKSHRKSTFGGFY